MITGAQLIDATRDALGDIQHSGETGMETFLLERGVEPDAIRVLCRCYGQEIVDSSEDVGAVVAQALILGFVAGFLARDAQVPA